MNIGLMSDSGADITYEEINSLGIRWLGVEIIYPTGKHIRDKEDIDIKAFYKDMTDLQGKFVSVQIKTEEIISATEELLEHNDYVLYITMSSKMSGTYLNALKARETLGPRLIVFDSRSISTGQALLTLKAFHDIKQGSIDINHIEEYLSELRSKLRFFFVLESLKYLKEGGRIGKASYLVGTMLKVKPALGIDDEGQIYAVDKIRGSGKKIIKFFESMMEKEKPNTDMYSLQFVHGIETKWDTQFKHWLNEKGILYQERLTRPTTTIHGGPYSLGLAWFV